MFGLSECGGHHKRGGSRKNRKLTSQHHDCNHNTDGPARRRQFTHTKSEHADEIRHDGYTHTRGGGECGYLECVCVCAGMETKKWRMWKCANCVPPWVPNMCVCMCASDRLGELRRLNTVAQPSVATRIRGGGPRLSVTRVTVPTAHHWDAHTCVTQPESKAPLCETHPEVQPFSLNVRRPSSFCFGSPSPFKALNVFSFKWDFISYQTKRHVSQNERRFYRFKWVWNIYIDAQKCPFHWRRLTTGALRKFLVWRGLVSLNA